MEDNKHEEQSIQESDVIDGSSEHAHVPASLLPTVLQRLGLAPEQARPEPSLDELRVQLRSDDWVVRVATVRAVGKLGSAIASELLLSVLDDQDSSVRAAAVQALGSVGKRVPLHRLVAALRDTDWHVRETAVLALAKQGPHVSKEVVMTALHDTDAAVREAAQFALHSLALEESASAPYGKLWERHTMQHDEYPPSPVNGTGTRPPLDSIPGYAWNGTGKRTGQFQGVREQAQAYASDAMHEEYAHQEFPAYEYGDTLPAHGGKLVLHRHGFQKGWWVALAAVAVLFFLLGSGVTALLVPMGAWMTFPRSEVVKVMPTMVSGQLAPFENPNDAWIAQSMIAAGLHLPPQEIVTQLKQGRSMNDIAAAQGVSPSQLHSIELKAMQALLDNAVKSGEIDQQQSDQWMQQFVKNPPLLEKIVMVVFSVGV